MKLYKSTYKPINVITDKGIKEIRNLVPSDRILEYGTNNYHTIMDISIRPEETEIVQINYSDGTKSYANISGKIFDGSNIIPIRKVMSCTNFGCINPYHIHNLNLKNIPDISVDPYVSGAFIVFGDVTNPYMNIPISYLSSELVEYLKYSYNIEISIDELTKYVYFHYTWSNDKITWSNFFYSINLYKNSIPHEYYYADYITRIKFLRGVFQTGDNKNNMFTMTCIYHDNLNILQQVYLMLKSCGIPSGITSTQDKLLPYKLVTIGEYFNYPLTYSDIQISEKINNQPLYCKEHYISINNIVPIHGIHIGNIYTDTHNLIYIDSKFNPIISL